MKQAIIYRRVSTGAQDNSLLAQEAATDQYVRVHGWSVRATIADEAVSGTLPLHEREGGRRLLAAIKAADPADTVLVMAKQDRFSRNASDALVVAELIWKRGLALHFALEGGEVHDNPSSRAMFGVKAVFSAYEASVIADRVRVVHRDKRNRAELTGTVPFGWDVLYTFADGHRQTERNALFFGGKRGKSGDGIKVNGVLIGGVHPPEPRAAALLEAHGHVTGKFLVDNPTEQQWARWVFLNRFPAWPDRTVKRLSLGQLAFKLNISGITTKCGSQWKPNSIHKLLDSTWIAALLAGQTIPTFHEESETPLSTLNPQPSTP